MSFLKNACLVLITPALLIGSTLPADEAFVMEIPGITTQDSPAPVEPQQSTTGEPRVIAKFYTADAIQAIPRLKALKDQDPESNKILFGLENFPTDKEIFVDIKRHASITPDEYETKFSFIVGDDGLIRVSNSDHQLRAIVVGSRGYLPGEKVYFRFHSADGTIDKEISGVPVPAIVYDKEGKQVIRAEMVSVLPTVYRIDLPQLEDGEEYELKASSVGETVKSRPKYNKAKGFMYSPAAKGISKGGDATLEIRKRKGAAYSITLPWGAMLDGYMTGKKIYSPKP